MFHLKSLSLFSRMNCSGAPFPLQLASRAVGLRVVVFSPAASVPSGTLLKMQIPSLSPHKCICGTAVGRAHQLTKHAQQVSGIQLNLTSVPPLIPTQRWVCPFHRNSCLFLKSLSKNWLALTSFSYRIPYCYIKYISMSYSIFFLFL